MEMKKYLLRSLRYFTYMIVLWCLIFVVMFATKTTAFSFETLVQLFTSLNGILLITLVVVVSLAYPKFGYTIKTIPRITRKKELIDQLKQSGMVLHSEKANVYVFQYASFFRRLMIRFDDRVVIVFENDHTLIEGNKVPVSRVLFRIESLIENE